MRLMMTRMARMKESWCLMHLWWWCKVHDNIDSCNGVSCHLHIFIILQRFYHTYEMPLSFQCNIDLRIFHCNCFEVLIQYCFFRRNWKGQKSMKKSKKSKIANGNILKYSPFLVSLLRKVWMSTCSNSRRSFYSIFQSRIQIAKYFTIALEWHNLPTFQLPKWDGNFVSYWAAYYIFNTSALHITMFQTLHLWI